MQVLFFCVGLGFGAATLWAKEDSSPVNELHSWQFIPGTFVPPGATAAWEQAFHRYIPGGWKDIAPNDQIGTFRTLFTPTIPGAYGLELAEINSAADLYVNGRWMGSLGHPALDKASTVPGRGRLIVSLPTAASYEILIHVSAFYNYSGGIWTTPKIGIVKALDEAKSQEEILESCFFAGILAIGVYHFFLFLIRREPLSALFGICCFAVALRMGFSNARIFHTWIDPGFHWGFFMEYASLYAIAPSIELFFATIFPQDYPRKIWPLRALPYALTFATLCFDVITMNRFLLYVHVHHIAVMLIVIYTLFKAVQNKRLGSLWILTGSVFMILFSLIDIGKTVLGYSGTFVIQIGFSVFIMSQAAAIAQVYNEIYRRLLVEEAKQVQLNEELQRLDRLKDDFLANTSHELRTPLHAMIGLSDSILQQEHLDSSTEHRVKMILTSARRLALLVNDILDFSKLRHEAIELQKVTVDLPALAHMVCELLRPMIGQKPVELSLQIEEGVEKISGDPNRLQQILLNLIGNAIKFTHEGRVHLQIRSVNPWLEIAVKDTGIGIPEEKINSIFDSFTQVQSSTAREFGGTGLGLAVTKKLVDLHKGSLHVDSKVGEGSLFTVRLPCDSPLSDESPVNDRTPITTLRHREPTITASEPPKKAGNTRILIADDDPINLEVLKAQLLPEGFELTCVGDAFAALKALDAQSSFDLALIDVMMPRMSGYELTRRIRESRSLSEMPIVLLTAKSQPEDVVHGFEAGANDYLVKPFARIELLARIHTLDSMRRQSQALSLACTELRQEELAKVLLVKDLAHRGNNPLNAGQLCLESQNRDLNALKQFINTLLEPIKDLDDEHRAVFNQIQNYFAILNQDNQSLLHLLGRVAQAIEEIRVLSGVDGRRTYSFDLMPLLRSIHLRLEESLGSEGAKRASLRFTSAGPFLTQGHPLVFVLSLERLVRQMIEDSQDPIDCFLEPEHSPVSSVHLEFRSAITGDALAWSEQSLELLKHLSYMLLPYGMKIESRNKLGTGLKASA